MSGFLLDTNVVSELRRREINPGVAAWFEDLDADTAFLSVLVVGEIRNGIERVAGRDPQQAGVFQRWLAELTSGFADRILPIDLRVAEQWGRLEAAGPLPVPDGLMAATAIVHDLTFVTRNTRHVERSGARLLHPWDAT